MSEATYKCATCKQTLCDKEFNKDIHAKRGRRASCKGCERCKRDKKKQNKLQGTKEVIDAIKEEPKAQPEPQTGKGPKYTHQIGCKWPVQTDYATWDWETKVEKDKHYLIAVVGSRNSGKTTLLANTWDFFVKRLDLCFLFSYSLQAPIYNVFLSEKDRKLCFGEFLPELLQELEMLQKMLNNELNIGIFLDDMSDEHGVKNANELMQLAIRGRNKKHTLYISTQSKILINKTTRKNIDFLALTKSRTPEERDDVVDAFLYDIIPVPPDCERSKDKKAYYMKWLYENTRHKTAMFIDYLNPQDEFDEMIYKYNSFKDGTIVTPAA